MRSQSKTDFISHSTAIETQNSLYEDPCQFMDATQKRLYNMQRHFGSSGRNVGSTRRLSLVHESHYTTLPLFTAEESSPKVVSRCADDSGVRSGGVAGTGVVGTPGSSEYRHSVYYCCSSTTSSTNLRNSYAEIPFNQAMGHSGSPSGSKGSSTNGPSPQPPVNNRVMLLSREDNLLPRNMGGCTAVAILTKPKTASPPHSTAPCANPGNCCSHRSPAALHKHPSQLQIKHDPNCALNNLSNPGVPHCSKSGAGGGGGGCRLVGSGDEACCASNNNGGIDSDGEQEAAAVPPPPGEPPSSDIESLYEASTLAPSSVYGGGNGRDKSQDPDYDCREEDFTNNEDDEEEGDYDMFSQGVVSTCSSTVSANTNTNNNNRYETAYPREEDDDHLDADRDLRLPPNAVVSPCCDDPRNTRTSSISNSSHHSNHQPHHQAKPSSKFGPSPKSKQSSPAYSTHSNNSSTNNKRDSPSGFEPILAPREKTKCVPKKVMKPIVGNASMTNSGVKTPDIDTSKAPVPTTNGVGSNMEEQCNSCSCFYHQVPVASSADQANPMKLREHNENCYENQYMVDVKAKNSSLLFANDVC